MKIVGVSAYQIFDSRGVPTLEAEVRLDDGTRGRGLVPSGASTGQFEAIELRDGDVSRWRGKSVRRAIENVDREIAPAILGHDPRDQTSIDRQLVELDGTPNKGRLGANAILGVSMAVADAAAKAAGVALFEYLGQGSGVLLPLPEIQMIGGGAHANWRTDVQDFLLVPIGARSYEEALEICHNVYHAAGDLLKQRGTYFGVADEGGYWPEFASHEAVFEFLVRSMEAAGYTPGEQAALALDIAASDLYDPATGHYHLRLEKRVLTTDEMVALVCDWRRRYPIVSLEDPLADTDFEGWRQLRAALGDRVQLVGDDLFTTNPDRIRNGIAAGSANAVLIKLNQIGTISETLEAIRLTQQANWRPIISARSGETEDTFIAHLAVATNAGQLKVGSFSRSERMAKWNELLRISRQLGERARFVAADANGAIAAPPKFLPPS
jgi:enolase